MDKIRIVVFQCVYMDSTVKQKERQSGKGGMVKGCVFVHEKARECGKREWKSHMKSTAGGRRGSRNGGIMLSVGGCVCLRGRKKEDGLNKREKGFCIKKL